VWTIKKNIVQKLVLSAEETLNYGIYLPKAGVYLEEHRTLASYYFSENVCTLLPLRLPLRLLLPPADAKLSVGVWCFTPVGEL